MPTPEPHRVETNRVPFELFIRPCTTNSRLYDIVDETGEFIAREVPDLNTARVLAAAPRLLDGFYEMRWRLNAWFEHGRAGVGRCSHWTEEQVDTSQWLVQMKEVEVSACALDGSFPL